MGVLKSGSIVMQEKKLVELGRVVHVTTGPSAGEIGAIVDIIDAKRMLVDGPRMPRREIKLKDMFLTRIMLKYNDVPSQKALLAMWEKNLVDARYQRTEHAKRLEKKAKRAACTDFEYFKVRCAARAASKIKENALKYLHAKHPRALSKMARKRRVDLGVALGYRTEKKLTPEEKSAKLEKEKAARLARKTKSLEYFKAKTEKRKKASEARKARTLRKKEAGKLKARPTVPKESRSVKRKSSPKSPKCSALKTFRRERDAERKSTAAFRKEHTKALQANRAARKSAIKAGTKPPPKLAVKNIKPKRSTFKKQVRKRIAANKEAKTAAE